MNWGDTFRWVMATCCIVSGSALLGVSWALRRRAETADDE